MNKSKRRILITGALGFVGTILTKQLLEKGCIVGITAHKNRKFSQLGDHAKHATIFSLDLCDGRAVISAVESFRPDKIIHLATYYAVNHSPSDIEIMTRTNVLGCINLLESARLFGKPLFVNTSSSFVYGKSKNKLTEDSQTLPFNLYALTKLQAEQACSFYAKNYNISVITLRLFPPYGPGDHERRLIPYVIESLHKNYPLRLTTGKQKWDFVYIQDIVDAFLKTVANPEDTVGHQIFNVGTGITTSVRDVVLLIRSIMRSESEPIWGAIPERQNEFMFMCADNTKSKAHLGWTPKISIRQGLKYTIKCYLNMLSRRT